MPSAGHFWYLKSKFVSFPYRRRDQSPPKQSGFFTPASSRSESKTAEVQPNKKNLFQKDWKSNDIAKSQEEAKRKDMEMLMNRQVNRVYSSNF